MQPNLAYFVGTMYDYNTKNIMTIITCSLHPPCQLFQKSDFPKPKRVLIIIDIHFFPLLLFIDVLY